MMHQSILWFDVDGTLVDIWKRHYHVYLSCIAARGGTALPLLQYKELRRSNQPYEYLCAQSNIPSASVTAVKEYIYNTIEQHEMLALDSLFRDTLSSLSQLQKNYLLGIVTRRQHHDRLLTQLNNFGIGTFFTYVCSNATQTKIQQIQRVTTPTSNDVLVGDTNEDIQTGKTLGIRTVGITTGLRERKVLAIDSPDVIVDSLSEVIAYLSDAPKTDPPTQPQDRNYS